MQSSEIDLKELIGILRRQSRLILITFFVFLIPAVLYLMLATPMYRATALISIDAGGSNLLDPGSIENSQSAILNSRVDGEVEVLRAEATVMAVVQAGDLISDPEFGPRLGLTEKITIALGMESAGDTLRQAVGLRPADPPSSERLVSNTVQKLSGATEIRRRGLTYLISVGVRSESPQRAADIANLYVATYIDRQVLTKSASIIAARDVLRSQTETARIELARLEDALNSFIDDNLARLEAESNNESISALRRQLEAAQSSKVESVSVLAASREAAARNDWASAAVTLGDAALEQLANEREALARRLSGETAGSQTAIDLQNALSDLDRSLGARLAEAQTSVEGELSALTQSETLAREQLREALLQSNMSSTVIADLFNLQQSASIARNQYQQLLARVQDLNALANVQIADARVVSEALPPTSPASPNKRLIIIMALTAALAMGVTLAFLNEYYIGGVTSTAQLANVIQARIPVAIPALPSSANERIPADEIMVSPLSQYSEGFRKLRLAVDTNLHQSLSERGVSEAERRKARVVLICSALPGEGKTTTAIALARTYAVSGQRTLLIDCDLRKPSVENYFKLPHQDGLIDYLTSQKPDADLVVTPVLDQLSNLEVITAGSRSTQPTDQLVNSPRFASLLEVVREAFDVIVIDSPPLLPVVDTRYLAQMADIAVLIVRFSNTTQGEVRDAAHQMQDALRPGVRMLGVLNRQTERRGKRGYYNGAYSGYYGDSTT
ncbi:polysaccharide biosynthesis tyrosine autokinase [Rhodobacter sp. ETT8]|uniref:non-specific protein-tyrosine kinase n=1 Tax=Pseudotabrizicola algicola TaxID=2709381 RepID=A0A6B3RH84_9RHOB|nr:polysaccharide biosynthesis tyrosine autokinase [Pseudotabrizicola algicola]NEX45330.1 polysaccharide biosynthesis tyrosine autokinase [Pseudotabrizicola algicola]